MTSSPLNPSAGASTKPPARVVLVGAGHAHLHLLQRWAENPPLHTELTLLVDEAESVYSGMVPGLLAGDYRWKDVAIAVTPLARRCGARLILRPAERIDPSRKIIEIAGQQPLEYDLASLDVGSTVNGLDLPGVCAHTLATRPIGAFARRLDEYLRTLPVQKSADHQGSTNRIVIVGAGAAGVELAFTLQHRLREQGENGGPVEIFVACGSGGLLPGYARRAQRLLAAEAARRGIVIAATSNVVSVDACGVNFGTGSLRADLVVWATGAAPSALLTGSSLPRDRRGFVRVTTTLEVKGHAGLFAAGDCCAVDGAEWMAKAGVYAVRAGPVLDFNLRAKLQGLPLRDFRPQREFLSLLNLGGQRALATKWGMAVVGNLAWRWKDRIDRAFVERYRD